MVRSRALIRLVPVALLLGVCQTPLLGLPLAARTPVSAAAPRQLVAAPRQLVAAPRQLVAAPRQLVAAPRQPVLAVPRALMHRAAIHVIVEMNDATPAAVLLRGSSQLQSLLSGVRGHLL